MTTECQDAYWKGLMHGMILLVPLLGFLYRKWKRSEAAVREAELNDPKKPELGSFLNELFAYEVVLVAGAEMKAVKDQLKEAEDQGNMKKVAAIKERLVDIASVLEKKLQSIIPIVQFLMEQSVNCLKAYNENVDASDNSEECKKDK